MTGRTCLTHQGRWVCLLDNLLHRLHLNVRWICDWHDRLLFELFDLAVDSDDYRIDNPPENLVSYQKWISL